MSHVVIVSQARVNHVFVSQLLCHGNCYYCKQLAFQTKEDVRPFTIINSEKDSGIGMAGIWNAMSACTICAVFSWKFRPRAHVSGYFGIRNFFSPDTASADTYPANPVYESTSCSFFLLRSPEWKFCWFCPTFILFYHHEMFVCSLSTLKRTFNKENRQRQRFEVLF